LPKVGKSTLVYAMIAAVTRGRSFLGLPARGASVLLLIEEAPATVEEKCDRFDIDNSKVYVLPLRAARGKTKWAKRVREVIRFCEEHPDIELVVVDTLDKFADIDAHRSENDAGVIRETVDPLWPLLATGVAVVLIFHHRKEPGEHGTRVRGGTGWVGAVDIIAELERSSNKDAPAGVRVLKFTSRFADAPERLTLELKGDEWTASTSAKAAARRWRRDHVLRLLTTEPATREEIIARAEGGLSEPTLRRRLGELVADGLAEIVGEGTRGDPKRWRLSQSGLAFVANPENSTDTDTGENRMVEPNGFLPLRGEPIPPCLTGRRIWVSQSRSPNSASAPCIRANTKSSGAPPASSTWPAGAHNTNGKERQHELERPQRR
jgi:AAA domain